MTKKKKQLNKVVALLLVFVLNFAMANEVFAYYSDVESSNENTFVAGSLDFLINNTEFDGVISNTPGDTSQFETTVVLDIDSFEMEYDVQYIKTGGSETVCDGLNIETNRGHDEALSGFVNLATTTLGLWSFTTTIPVGPLPIGETCEFDLVFSGLIEGETGGYSDEERMNLTITIENTDTVVLNEFLPRPDGEQYGFDFGNDSANLPQGEWVELYNLTSNPIDLTGWYTEDSTGGAGNTIVITSLNTVPATTIIPANGYLVVYMNKPIWNNTGDTVKLFNGSDELMDSYSYSSDYSYCDLEPTPGGTNDTTPGGGDSCGNQVPGNKSYARIPDGTGAFVDPIPTPGNLNILDEESAALIQGPVQAETVMVEDTEAPVITVVGNNPALIVQGTEYSDLGARVTDNINDNLGITAEGEDIDASVLGEYTILYTATDQAGNRGSTTRLVVVYDPANGIPQIEEEEEVIEELLVIQSIPPVEEIIEVIEEIFEEIQEEPVVEELPVEEEEIVEEVVEEVIEEVILEEVVEEPIVEEEVVEPIVEEVVEEVPVEEEPAEELPVEEETPLEEVLEEPVKKETEEVPVEEIVVEEVIEEISVVVEELPVEEEVEEPTE